MGQRVLATDAAKQAAMYIEAPGRALLPFLDLDAIRLLAAPATLAPLGEDGAPGGQREGHY